MKTIQYTTRDKSTWGDGPWQHEPDKMQYEDFDTGLPCLIVRNEMGALCGYVGVQEGHQFFGKSYADIDDIDVHGGLTFAAHCHPDAPEESGICHIPAPGESDKVWWLGFDCAHAGDLIPSMNELSPLLFRSFQRPDRYRDIDYVRSQIASLAEQLKAA